MRTGKMVSAMLFPENTVVTGTLRLVWDGSGIVDAILTKTKLQHPFLLFFIISEHPAYRLVIAVKRLAGGGGGHDARNSLPQCGHSIVVPSSDILINTRSPQCGHLQYVIGARRLLCAVLDNCSAPDLHTSIARIGTHSIPAIQPDQSLISLISPGI